MPVAVHAHISVLGLSEFCLSLLHCFPTHHGLSKCMTNDAHRNNMSMLRTRQFYNLDTAHSFSNH